MKCSDCGGKVGGSRRGPRCHSCDKIRNDKFVQDSKIAKLVAGVDYVKLLPRHKGKR